MAEENHRNAGDKDRREAPRVAVNDDAIAIMRSRNETIDCLVVDISDTGAKIISNGKFSEPVDSFKLFIPSQDTIFECEKIWTEDCCIGVKIVSAVNLID